MEQVDGVAVAGAFCAHAGDYDEDDAEDLHWCGRLVQDDRSDQDGECWFEGHEGSECGGGEPSQGEHLQAPGQYRHEDEPIRFSSSVALYHVSALAQQSVKVVLTGEGSDELLAGYGKYPRSLLNWRAGGVYEQATPRHIRRLMRERVVPRLPARLRRLAARSFLSVGRTPESMFFDTFAGLRVGAWLVEPREGPSTLGAVIGHGCSRSTLSQAERPGNSS